MLDVAINHGPDFESFKPIIDKMKNKHERDELKWFSDFVDTRRDMLRRGFRQLDTSKTGDRCMIWKKLGDERNLELKRPIIACDGYWGKRVMI